MIPGPPVPFPDINRYRIAAGTPLHRNHLTTLRSAEFNPGAGAPSRFAPFGNAAGRPVPTLYAAATREAAAFETIFHDVAPAAQFNTVTLDAVERRAASEIACARDLVLAALFTPDLRRWGLARRDLIDTPKSDYVRTAAWAAAIHAAAPDLDGLAWTSRQCDPAVCVVLFGDRTSEADFTVVDRIAVASSAALLLELRGFGRRAGIDLVN